MTNESIHKNLNSVTKANQRMHDVLANYYDVSNLIILEEGTESQVRVETVIKDLAARTTGECLIDVGCGTGNVLRFSEMYFKKSLGIDVSYEMLLRSKDKKSELVRGDINYLPFKSALADTMSCFSVVHHLYEFDLLFNEIYRVLKPNGYFYSDNDPNEFSTELHDLNKQSAFFRALMGVCFIPLRFSRGFRERTRLLKEFNNMLSEKGTAEDFNEISLEAEYHLQNGIDPYAIKKKLEQVGFVDIQIYFHFRRKELREKLNSMEKLSLLMRMLLKPKISFHYNDRRLKLYELAPYFAILARKPA